MRKGLQKHKPKSYSRILRAHTVPILRQPIAHAFSGCPDLSITNMLSAMWSAWNFFLAAATVRDSFQYHSRNSVTHTTFPSRVGLAQAHLLPRNPRRIGVCQTRPDPRRCTGACRHGERQLPSSREIQPPELRRANRRQGRAPPGKDASARYGQRPGPRINFGERKPEAIAHRAVDGMASGRSRPQASRRGAATDVRRTDGVRQK
jgi:hypothetical protein